MILFIGTYTDGGDFVPTAKGNGIMSCRMNEKTGMFSQLHRCAEVVNPSWIHLADGGKRLFAVSETFDRPGEVHGFEVEPEGGLKQVSSHSSRGLATCHLTTTPDYLYAASYLDGRLSVYPRRGAEIRESVDVVKYSGLGPVTERQEAAHAHQAVVSPDNRWLYVCDLGSDRIRRHELRGGFPFHAGSVKTPSGSGPRHLIFHPKKSLVWALCELNPLILTFLYGKNTGELQLFHTLNLADCPELEGVGAAAAIYLHPSAEQLGISERTTNSIALFVVEETGEPTFRQLIRTEDETPRDFIFTPDGRWLIAAYQDSNSLSSHAVDDFRRVMPNPADCLEVNSPVCIAEPISKINTF